MSKRVVEFDLDRYLRNSKKVDLSMIEWEDVAAHPLTQGEVEALHFAMDIEIHTVIYLRDLLATRAAHDPQVTAFLACWVYEELWHGEAVSDFLRAYGIEVPAEPRLADGSTPMPTRPNRIRRLREGLGAGHKLSLLPTMLGSMVARDFVALHMTWGAFNELTTLTAYYQLIRRSEHPVLGDLLQKLIQDERRHFAFYRAQAKARLSDRPSAQRLVRTALKALWTPVGAGVKTQQELDDVMLYTFGDSAEGREAARSIDETISELPGLGGLRLFEQNLDDAIDRANGRSRDWETAPARLAGEPRPPLRSHWRTSAGREDAPELVTAERA